MRRLAYCSALLVMAGCASGGQAPGPTIAPPPRDIDVNPNDASFNLAVRREANIVTAALAAPADSLWNALVLTFDELKLPATTIDPAQRLLVSSSPRRTTSIAGQRIARFFECPATGYGNSAQGQDTYVTIKAQLLPAAAGGADLRMETQANVVLNGAASQCRSTARLEQMIAQGVARRARLIP